MHKILFNRPRLRQHKLLGQERARAPSFLSHATEEACLARLECFTQKFSRLLILGDVSPLFVKSLQKKYPQSSLLQGGCSVLSGLPGCLCEEESLPFPGGTFDLVISMLTFHLCNRPQKALQEVLQVLKAGGLYLSSFLGGKTLVELRTLLLQMELDQTGGACQRVIPMIDSQVGTALLQQAGFQEPVTESETLTSSFPSLLRLRLFLKSMGEQAPLVDPQPLLPKRLVSQLESHYRALFPSPESGLLATFEVLSYTGWKSQN